MSQLARTMEPNEKAYQQIKSAQKAKRLNSILGFAGVFLIGWPLGTTLGEEEPKWTIVGIGAGFYHTFPKILQW